MIVQHARSDEYTALSDRMGYLMVLRVAMAIVAVAWSGMRPESLSTPFAAFLACHGGLRRCWRRSRSSFAAAPDVTGSP